MELLAGETLRARLDREGTLEPACVLSIVRQICQCLEEAHAAGVLHRDLKPENVYLCPSSIKGSGPSDLFVKVLDFGLAKLSELNERMMNITSPSVTVGTPAYLAPEMALSDRKIDSRADLYALGVMTFEMLCGRLPFDEKTPHQMLMAHVRSPIPRPSQLASMLPKGCDAFMTVALAKQPEERFQSASAFAASLASAVGERRR
jgi:serine/threonine-protein kinase